jgi:hypothetical protein
VLLATDVAIWMPACAASPDGTCTNTAGRDAVNALEISQHPWKLIQSMETTISSAVNRHAGSIQSRIKMPTNAYRKRPQCTRHLTFFEMHWRKVSHHISNPTNQNHYRELFWTSLINHQQTKSESRNLG